MENDKEDGHSDADNVDSINDDTNRLENTAKFVEESVDEPYAKVPKLAKQPNQEIDLTLNPALERTEFMRSLRKNWIDAFADEGFKDTLSEAQVYKEPFQLCLLPELLQYKDSCRSLVNEMVEKVHWSRKQMDLYEFYQSTDLSNMAECTNLTKFLHMLRRHVRPWLEQVTNLKLDYVSASCSMYTGGDYLLVHDDLLKDRQVAFIYYLSPWEGVEQWPKEYGGCLELFNTDERCLPQFPVCRKIAPKNNQFAFFKVGSRSFHQVGEVTTFDYPRLTINGWFHGATNNDFFANTLRPFTKLNFKAPQPLEARVEEMLNAVYLQPTTRRSIQKRIEDNSEICLYEFFKRDMFQQSLEQLLHDSALQWRRQGPANAQNYEVLEFKSAKSTLAQLIKVFSSKEMFALLRDYTDLDLAGPNTSEPSCSLELQRWTHGNYTVLDDGAICDENTLDLIYYLNAAEGAGVVTYLSPDDDESEKNEVGKNKYHQSTETEHFSESENDMEADDTEEEEEEEGEDNKEEDDSVLLTIVPIDNSLNVVYRCEGTTKFTKYVSLNTPMDKGPVFVLSCSYKEYRYRLYASLSFMTVVIIVGVPMWWKTTEVYRVSLPSDDILRLGHDAARTTVNIGIFAFKPERSELLIQELNAAFVDNELWHIKFHQIAQIENATTAVTPARLEALILKQHPLNTGDFLFIEWPKLSDEFLLTTERSALFKPDASAAKMRLIINILILQTFKMQKTQSENGRTTIKNDPPQTEYDVVISVLNPRPDIMDVKWNVKMAVETYIDPFLRAVNQVSNFTLKTQWKYQLAFEADLKQIRDDTKIGRHYAISESSLPYIITSIEKNLGVGITDKSAINLIVYVPPCEIAPLHIYTHQNKLATRNNVDSFISPKWGGVIIANPPMETCISYNSEPKRVGFHVNTNDVMQIMLYQLQKLLDIAVNAKIDGVKIVDLEQLEPRRWEYESYIRRSTIGHIGTASQTLQSLIKLLDNISYIVINDDVGEAINDAYRNILHAKSLLESSDLINASIYAKRAYISSEHAFFDASLLAQLYFPDEQKYAIYIPLFLPIMVPVISSFSTIRKLYIQLRTARKVKTN